jgi:hypothetical protein
MLAYLLASVALAAEPVPVGLDVQNFHASIDAGPYLRTDPSDVQDGQLALGAWVNYARSPFVYQDPLGEVTAVVQDLGALDLGAAYGFGPVRAGVLVPVFLAGAPDAPLAAGVGDLAADVKAVVLAEQDGHALHGRAAPLGLAVDVRVGLPTGPAARVVLASGKPTMEASLVVDKRLGRVRMAANLGTRVLPTAELVNVTWDDQFTFRTAAAVDLGKGGSPDSGASLELFGNATYTALDSPAGVPMELMLGGWHRPGTAPVYLRAGVGTGVTRGLGSPRVRAVLAVTGTLWPAREKVAPPPPSVPVAAPPSDSVPPPPVPPEPSLEPTPAASDAPASPA